MTHPAGIATEKRNKKIRLMRESGMTWKSIGATFGLSRERVRGITFQSKRKRDNEISSFDAIYNQSPVLFMEEAKRIERLFRRNPSFTAGAIEALANNIYQSDIALKIIQ